MRHDYLFRALTWLSSRNILVAFEARRSIGFHICLPNRDNTVPVNEISLIGSVSERPLLSLTARLKIIQYTLNHAVEKRQHMILEKGSELCRLQVGLCCNLFQQFPCQAVRVVLVHFELLSWEPLKCQGFHYFLVLGMIV